MVARNMTPKNAIKLDEAQKRAWERIKTDLKDPDYRFDLEIDDDGYDDLSQEAMSINARAIKLFDLRIHDQASSLLKDVQPDESDSILSKGVFGDGFYGVEVYPEDLIRAYAAAEAAQGIYDIESGKIRAYDAESGCEVSVSLAMYRRERKNKRQL